MKEQIRCMYADIRSNINTYTHTHTHWQTLQTQWTYCINKETQTHMHIYRYTHAYSCTYKKKPHWTHQTADRPKARLLNPVSSFFFLVFFFSEETPTGKHPTSKKAPGEGGREGETEGERERGFGPSQLLNSQPILFRWVTAGLCSGYLY